MGLRLRAIFKHLHFNMWHQRRRLSACFWMQEVFFCFNCTTQRLALYACVVLQSFSLALLQLIGVKIPQKYSQVFTDASHPCTHTGSWITIFFVRLIALLWLFVKSSRGSMGLCMNVQSHMDEIYFSSNGNEIVWDSCDLFEDFKLIEYFFFDWQL